MDFMTIPDGVWPDFWQDSLQKNRLSLLLISMMIFGMELFNMARVLFFSPSGLRSANNRIYFTLYSALFLGAALALLLQRLLRGASLRAQWILHACTAGFFLLWHVVLNRYDFARDSSTSAYPFVTAVVGLAMFFQIPYAMSMALFGLGYTAFMLLSASFLDVGSVINLTMTTIVMLAISFTRCRHAVIELSQRREIAQINVQLQQMLQKDPLTGLLNKTAVQTHIAKSLENRAEGDEMTVFMMDLDNFKFINDHYGHPCGDHVLEEAARRMRMVFFDAACVGRIGGDEFMALLSAPPDSEAPEARGRELLRSLAEIRWKGEAIEVACSIGVLRVARRGVGYDQLYAEADRALYEAKQQGKGCCRLRTLD